MKLRTYTARSHGEAFAMAARELGDDAVIVDSEDAPEGVRLLVAAQPHEGDLAAIFDGETAEQAAAPDEVDPHRREIERALAFHKVEDATRDRLLAKLEGRGDAADQLAGALADLFTFRPLAPAAGAALAFCGPCGAGASAGVAKTAASALLNGLAVTVFESAARPAAVGERLKALLAPMDLRPQHARPDRWRDEVGAARARGAFVLIDMIGAPRVDAERGRELAAAIEDAAADALLVLPAGLDADECRDHAAAHHAAGVERLAVTRLDCARRYGGALAAADAGLALAQFGYAPDIASPLAEANPARLARLLLRDDQNPEKGA